MWRCLGRGFASASSRIRASNRSRQGSAAPANAACLGLDRHQALRPGRSPSRDHNWLNASSVTTLGS